MLPYLIIRGAPGAGKSSIATSLRDHFPNGITIEVDLLRGMMHGHPWGNHTHHRNAVQAAALLAQNYRTQGYQPVIIVDCLVGQSLYDLLQHLGHSECTVYTLTAADVALTQRIRNRDNHGFKDTALALSLNLEILNNPLPIDHQIDTTTQSPQSVAALIAAAFSNSIPK